MNSRAPRRLVWPSVRPPFLTASLSSSRWAPVTSAPVTSVPGRSSLSRMTTTRPLARPLARPTVAAVELSIISSDKQPHTTPLHVTPSLVCALIKTKTRGVFVGKVIEYM